MEVIMKNIISFSPLNREVILKLKNFMNTEGTLFQSPQWGSNSKGFRKIIPARTLRFQSPQWGSNSKGRRCITLRKRSTVSVPSMGK